ncbi:hypothetical protein AB0L82_11140 [Nocardia sp. NPDC052001]|uniref:hypothetical protein n=1 Tax=Nocardia sp. NPDC052001 TaxID=3154853 RepID=UPI00342CB902
MAPQHNPWPDLAALTIITAAVVALVVYGNANAAVVTAAGGLIAGVLRIWRSPGRR